MSSTKARRQWRRIQPISLRNALELCKDHARERLNRSVERVADEMGALTAKCPGAPPAAPGDLSAYPAGAFGSLW